MGWVQIWPDFLRDGWCQGTADRRGREPPHCHTWRKVRFLCCQFPLLLSTLSQPPLLSLLPPILDTHHDLKIAGKPDSSAQTAKRTQIGSQFCYRSKIKIIWQVFQRQTCLLGLLWCCCRQHCELLEWERAQPEVLERECLSGSPQDLNSACLAQRAGAGARQTLSRYARRNTSLGSPPGPQSSQVGGGWKEVQESGLGACCSDRARPYNNRIIGQGLPKSKKVPRAPVTAVQRKHVFDFVGETGQVLEMILSSLGSRFPSRSELGCCGSDSDGGNGEKKERSSLWPRSIM